MWCMVSESPKIPSDNSLKQLITKVFLSVDTDAAIDGYSRKLLWLKCGPSNNNHRYIAQFYLDFLKEIGRVPRLLRCDRGTENAILRDMQIVLRFSHGDLMRGMMWFMYGRSTANQQIESFWSRLRLNFTDFWRNIFLDMRDTGIFHDADAIHVQCLRFCFLSVIQRHLDTYRTMWNSHRIRQQRNGEGGFIPNIAYESCELFGAVDHSFPLSCRVDDLDDIFGEYVDEYPERGCSTEFLDFIRRACRAQNNQLPLPTSPDDALQLFRAVIAVIETIQDRNFMR
ncbi:uncharacterized protein LOC141909833 [Tubulanus polymorphus]|uniref:uncharacterized protein LOC141909833 n=1 Tax=Tubulanus polymorphus TaxID=672921 RepID=UPI003DA600DC